MAEHEPAEDDWGPAEDDGDEPADGYPSGAWDMDPYDPTDDHGDEEEEEEEQDDEEEEEEEEEEQVAPHEEQQWPGGEEEEEQDEDEEEEDQVAPHEEQDDWGPAEDDGDDPAHGYPSGAWDMEPYDPTDDHGDEEEEEEEHDEDEEEEEEDQVAPHEEQQHHAEGGEILALAGVGGGIDDDDDDTTWHTRDRAIAQSDHDPVLPPDVVERFGLAFPYVCETLHQEGNRWYVTEWNCARQPFRVTNKLQITGNDGVRLGARNNTGFYLHFDDDHEIVGVTHILEAGGVCPTFKFWDRTTQMLFDKSPISIFESERVDTWFVGYHPGHGNWVVFVYDKSSQHFSTNDNSVVHLHKGLPWVVSDENGTEYRVKKNMEIEEAVPGGPPPLDLHYEWETECH